VTSKTPPIRSDATFKANHDYRDPRIPKNIGQINGVDKNTLLLAIRNEADVLFSAAYAHF
jgi:hypothetical protein